MTHDREIVPVHYEHIRPGQTYHWWDDGEPPVLITIVGMTPDGRPVAYCPRWVGDVTIIDREETASMELVLDPEEPTTMTTQSTAQSMTSLHPAPQPEGRPNAAERYLDSVAGTRMDPRIGSVPWLWFLLFGSLYLAYKGLWLHAIINLLFFWTIIIPIIYAFQARDLVHQRMLRKGLLN